MLLALLCAGAARADDWVRARSKNFTLVSDAGESKARRLAVELEQFRHVISLLFPNAQIETPVATTVYLFRSHESFRPFKPRHEGRVKENVGGYFMATPDGNYITLTAAPRGAVGPEEIIFHEYEHFVMRNNLPRAPLWLNEGLAEFYSTFSPSDDGQKVQLGAPIARHIAVLRDARGRLPLAELLAVDQKSPHYNEGSKAGLFYAKSWALVHYLMLGDDARRQSQFRQFIARTASDMTVEENFRQSFQADFRAIEKELDAYISRFMFPVLTVTFNKQLDFSKDVETARLTEAESLRYLGDLLAHAGQAREAEKYLEKSLGLDPGAAPARVSLAYVRLRQRRLGDAYKLLEEAVRLDPASYLARYHYANALAMGGRLEEAVAAYREAARLNPAWPRAQSGLASALSALGRDEEAAAALKAAIALSPRDANLFRSLAYAQLRLGQGGTAASNALLYLRKQGWRDDHAPYVFFAAYLGLTRSRQTPVAERLLGEAASKMNAAEWPYPVLQYFRRELTAEQLVSAAGDDRDKLTEAHAYAGLSLSIAGEREAALPHLRWVADNGNRNFVEYPLAVAEIRRLEQPRTTP